MNKIFIWLIFCVNISSVTFADISKEKLPIPRFVTIKFDEVNVRTGPVVDCPVEWVFIRKGEPVEIIAEYEQWRKIRDLSEEGGWVHASALSAKRSVILISKNISLIIKMTLFPVLQVCLLTHILQLKPHQTIDYLRDLPFALARISQIQQNLVR